MKSAKLGLLASVIAATVVLIPSASQAEPAVRQVFAQPLAAPSSMPWYIVPGRFLFSGNYYTHLNITEMRIDHVSENSRCTRRNRTFMISASFAQPIGNRLFSSQFELPLFSADRLKVSRLAPASVGDYVIHLTNAPLYGSAAQMLLSARF